MMLTLFVCWYLVYDRYNIPTSSYHDKKYMYYYYRYRFLLWVIFKLSQMNAKHTNYNIMVYEKHVFRADYGLSERAMVHSRRVPVTAVDRKRGKYFEIIQHIRQYILLLLLLNTCNYTRDRHTHAR